MSIFKRRKPATEEQLDAAAAAIERAEQSIAATRLRAPEVNRLTDNLELRKTRNHFGEALTIAMEARK